MLCKNPLKILEKQPPQVPLTLERRLKGTTSVHIFDPHTDSRVLDESGGKKEVPERE